MKFYHSIGGSGTRNGYVNDFLRDNGRDPSDYVMVELDEIFRVLSLQAGVFYPTNMVSDFTNDVGVQQFAKDLASSANTDCMLALKNNMWSKKRFNSSDYPPIEVFDYMIELATKNSTFTERMADSNVRANAVRYALGMLDLFGARYYISGLNEIQEHDDLANCSKHIADWVLSKHHNICMMTPYYTIVFEIHDDIVPHINKHCLHLVDDINLYKSQIDIYKVGFTSTGKWFVDESIAVLVPKNLKQGGSYYGLSSHAYEDVPSLHVNPIVFNGKNADKNKTPALRAVQKMFSYTSALHTFAAHHATTVNNDTSDKTLGRSMISMYAYLFPFDMKNALYVDVYQSTPTVCTVVAAAAVGTAIALDQCNKCNN